ncbi:hypothetical protein R6Q59_032936 [Mikania micrantha]
MDGSRCTPELPTTVVRGGAAATPVACRWNPTKEQINSLENLYVQGMRTPTEEQIQEITCNLKAYGQVEAKNVFYWFQNHKARQRQKEKQKDRLSLFQQYNHLHRHRPMSFIHQYPPSNGFYAEQHQRPQAVLPSTTTRPMIKKRSPRSTRPRSTAVVAGFTLMLQPENDIMVGGGSKMMQLDETVTGKNYSRQETLDLFPVHPTGILQDRVGTSSRVRTRISGSCVASRGCTSGDD